MNNLSIVSDVQLPQNPKNVSKYNDLKIIISQNSHSMLETFYKTFSDLKDKNNSG